MEDKLPREHVDIQFLSLCVSLLAFLGLAYWAGDIVWFKDFQPFITLISGIFALFIGVIALLRYYTKQSSLNFLFIGIGFLGIGLLDIFQVVLDLGGIGNLFTIVSTQVYPVTSVLSKTFLSVVMFISWLVSRKEGKNSKGRKKNETLLMGLVAGSFVLFIGVFIFLMMTGVVVDSLAVIIVGLVSLMFLILSLLGYLLNRGWVTDDFNYWIIFLISFLILSQIFYLPFFNLEYSNMMNLSVWARFFAYIGLLIGFLNSIYVMFQKEVSTQKELAKKNKQLDETKAKIEEAYLMLREEKWSLARSKGSVDKILKDVMGKK
ncbi:hypothetical protein KKA50_01930 [Patescibacteria group bacterium]|nr:hypothetical protein [Patescibacteria group bacterium]